jgi:hypothetical protein
MSKSDGARCVLSIDVHPPGEKPVRRIEMKRLECRQPLGSGTRDLPHHGVDEARVAGIPGISLDQPHGKIDRRMLGNIKKKKLRGTDQERVFDLGAALWETPIQKIADQTAECSKPPQHGRHNATRQGPVAFAKFPQTRIGVSIVQLLVQRPIATQHSVEKIGRSPSRRKAGRMKRGGLSEGARHFQDVVPERHPGRRGYSFPSINEYQENENV